MLIQKLKNEEKHADCTTSETGQITDNQLMKSVVISVVSILTCLLLLVGLTWCWFSDDVSSEMTITAGSFDVDINITINGAPDKAVLPCSVNTCEYKLENNQTYMVTIHHAGTAQSGFCHVYACVPDNTGVTHYVTPNIPKQNEEGNVGSCTFVITGFSSIKFVPSWGQPPEGANEIKDQIPTS